MDTTRIVELFIEDDFEESGIEAISLVSRPAHDEKWMAFKSDSCSCNVDEKFEEVEELFPYTVHPISSISSAVSLDEFSVSMLAIKA